MNQPKSLLTELSEAIDRYRAGRRAEQKSPSCPGRLRRFVQWLTPNGGTLLLVTALILTQNVWAKPLMSTLSAPGPSATTVNYQGRLADSGGAPLDGTYGMRFALYDTAIDGNLVWGPEVHDAVPVSDGLFSVGLGSQTSGGIPTSTWNGDRYLEITVGGETLSPRELIRSVPIAGMALTVPDGRGPSQVCAPELPSRGARFASWPLSAVPALLLLLTRWGTWALVHASLTSWPKYTSAHPLNVGANLRTPVLRI
jgi:hypothetical protein